MHLIVALDTESKMHPNFVSWMGARDYKPNPTNWNVRVREIKLYDLTFSKSIEPKVLSDLRFFQSSCAGTMAELPGLALKIGKYLNLCPKSIESVNMDNVKPTPFKDMNLPYNEKSFWAGVAVLGKLNDGEGNDGHELL